MNYPVTVRVIWFALAVAVTMGCGSGTARTAREDLPTLTMQLADQLKTVNDEASAKAARPKLEELADKIGAIKEQVIKGKYPKPANLDDFAIRQNKAVDAYTEEFKRVNAIPEVVPELQGMIKKLMQ